MNFWADEFQNSFPDLDAVLGNFGTSPEFLALSADLSTTELIEGIFLRSFSRFPDAEGLAFYTDRLDSGAANLGSIAKQILDGAQGVDEEVLSNKVAFATAYTAADPTIADVSLGKGLLDSVNSTDSSLETALADVATTFPGSGTGGDSQKLTLGQDDLSGTAGDDVFEANIFNNSNTLQSGDMVDGGEGFDLLYADIGNSQSFAITPDTESVDGLIVRAQTNPNDASDNNLGGGSSLVQIDAQRMDGTDWFQTLNSRSTVAIEDVRIDDDQITKDITVAMVSTDPGEANFGVYFDQPSLRAAAAETVVEGGTLTLQLMDIDGQEDDNAPFSNNIYNAVTFSLGGEIVELTFADVAGLTATYADLLASIQAALAAKIADGDIPALAGVTAAFGADFDVFNATSGTQYTGQSIVLTNTGAELFELGNWESTGSVPPDSNYVTTQSILPPDSSTDDPLITSTIIIDDVGRGSQGGDLIVGGLSTGATSSSRGVEQFDIIVERDSKLGVINSTNNTLEEVYIVNGTNQGNLAVNGANAGGNDLIGDNNQDNAYGFSDVRVLDASAMVGSVTLTAELSVNALAKYLQPIEEDIDANASSDPDGEAADDLVFDYDLGTSNDYLSMMINTGLLEDSDFSLVIDGNEGNDIIITDVADEDDTNSWYTAHNDLANLAINGGAGDDWIQTKGEGDFIISGGSGNDAIFTDNTGGGTTILAGSVATVGVKEIHELTFSAANVSGGGTIVVGGISVVIGEGFSAAQVADTVANALDGSAVFSTAVSDGVDEVTVTYVADGNVAATVVTDTATALSAPTTVVQTNQGTSGNGAIEVQTLSLAGLTGTAAGGTLTVGGVSIPVTAGAADTVIATAVETAFASNAAFESVVATTSSVVFTWATNGVKAALATTAAAGTLVPTTPGVADVQTITFSAGQIPAAGSTFTFNGRVIAGDGATQAAALVIASYGATADPAFASVAAGAGQAVVVTFAATNTGVKPLIEVVDADGTADASVDTVTQTGGTDEVAAAMPGTTETSAGTDSSAATLVSTITNTGTAPARTITTDIEGISDHADDSNAIWTANNFGGDNEVQTLDVVADSVFTGIKGQLMLTFKGLDTALITIADNATAYDIRQALKEAVAGDIELSKMLEVKDGPQGTFVIESLIDGDMLATDLAITFYAPLASTDTAIAGRNQLTLTEETAGLTAFDAVDAQADYTLALALADDGSTVLNGADSILVTATPVQAPSANAVNAGSGDNDLIVMGTSDATDHSNPSFSTNDTAVFTGSFGQTTIVNFTIATAVNEAGVSLDGDDLLDFTAYLTGTASDSYVAGGATLTDNDIILNSDSTINVYTTAASTAASGVVLVTSATDANVATVYTAVSTAATTAVTLTAVGIIDLADVSIASLTAADFV